MSRLSTILDRLKSVKEYLKQTIPPALDRTAEILHQFELAIREAADFIRDTTEGKLMSAEADEHRANAFAYDELKSLNQWFAQQGSQRPGAVHMTRAVPNDIPASTEVALYQIGAFISGEILHKIETAPSPKPQIMTSKDVRDSVKAKEANEPKEASKK